MSDLESKLWSGARFCQETAERWKWFTIPPIVLATAVLISGLTAAWHRYWGLAAFDALTLAVDLRWLAGTVKTRNYFRRRAEEWVRAARDPERGEHYLGETK